jgi:4'-phosphopantetheinyl transferase
MLRRLLGFYLGVAPHEVRFVYGLKGKPLLNPIFESSGLNFNLSHSQGQVLIAVAHGVRVGVDIEWIRPEMEVEKIARRFFTVGEVEALRALSMPVKAKSFFNAWTRKEAYLKAQGDGICSKLGEFAVSLSPGEPARLLFDRTNPCAEDRWTLYDLDLANGYAGCLAVEGRDLQVRGWEWTQGDADCFSKTGDRIGRKNAQ